MQGISEKTSPKVRVKATPEELAERAEQRRLRCLELKAIVAEEATRRGGKCEHPGCEVQWRPGTGPRNPNPLHWHHRQPRAEAAREREYRHPRTLTISELVNRAKTTDKQLKDELKRCTLLCQRHHKAADMEKRGRISTRKRKLAKGIDPADLEKLIAAPNIRYDNGLRWRLVIELMAKCGMRVSEVCNLTKIEIKDAKTGDRVIYLPPELEPLMNIWLGRRPDTHPHALRHTFATEFLRKPGKNVAQLQAILGHTTGTMSLRYAMANPDDVRRAMRGD